MYAVESLANSVPDCDVVFTDKAARDALHRRGLGSWLATALPRTVEELSNDLHSLQG